jgi:hypothetical protein
MIIRNKLHFANVIAGTKNKYFSITTKGNTILCLFSEYIKGKFIFKTKTQSIIVAYEDIQKIKAKGIEYNVQK